MRRRDKLEADLAIAEAELLETERKLARAEDDLGTAIIFQAEAKLEGARARAQQARADASHALFRRNQLRYALEIFNRTRPVRRPDETPARGATPLSTRPGEHTVGKRQDLEETTSDGTRPGHSAGFSWREHVSLMPSGAPAWRLLARQSVGLLALVSAYLPSYFFDVQLQIEALPSVTVYLVDPHASRPWLQYGRRVGR